MIKFTEGWIPEKRLTTLTAYIDELSLMNFGKDFVKTIISELVKQSVLIHRIDIENIVSNYIMLPETRSYIENKINEAINKQIQKEVDEIFGKSE